MLKKIAILFAAVSAVFAASAQKTARVYGVRVFSDPSEPPALVSFPVDDTSRLTEEYDLTEVIGESVIETGTVRAAASDGIKYFMLVSEDGMMPYHFVSLDLSSKKIDKVKSYYHSKDPLGSIIVNDIAYNPDDGRIYGVGYDLATAEVNGDDIDAKVALFVMDPTTGDSEILGLQDYCAFCAITFNAYGDLMGVDTDGNLWLLSMYDGLPLEQLESTGISPVGTQSMTTDYSTGDMYWASFSAVGDWPVSSLVKISMTEDWMFTVTDLGEVANATELVGLYVDPDPISELAPAVPEAFDVKPAPEGGLSAYLSWVNPSLRRDGSKLGEFTVNVYAGDVKIASIDGALPGEACSYEYAATEPAPVTFSVAASTEDGEGARAYADQVFVGEDRPAAVAAPYARRPDPAKYDIAVSWEAPAVGARGGWIDCGSLRYKVVRRIDGKVVADGISETSVTDADITATGAYIYDIIPATGAGEGVAASTAPCISGPSIVPPYSMNLADENDANLWTVANGDGDEYLWSILKNWGGSDTSYRFYPVELVGGVQPTDDWLISPSFSLEAGKYYSLSYDVRLWGDLFPATYTVNIGNGARPSDLTRVLESREQVVNNMVWERRSLSFAVEKSGDYNIGFGVLLANPMEVKGVSLREIAKIDMAADLLAGAVATSVGEPAKYTVTVSNTGYDAVESYEVRLEDADGVVLASRVVEDVLPSMASARIDIEWTPEVAGSYVVSACVTADADGISYNDRSDALHVSVFPAGNWHDIADGKTYTAFAPFALRYRYSGAQTIYSAEELGAAPAQILGMEYAYMPMGSFVASDFDIRIAMANTEVEDFDSSEILEAEEFTDVYEGVMRLDPANSKVTIVFDRPFEYSGGNLCVQTQHSADQTVNMLFTALSPKEGAKVSAVYTSDTAPYDFSSAGLYTDRPNVSMLMSKGSGVDTVSAAGDNLTVMYDRSASRLILSKVSEVKVVSMQGVTLLSAVGSSIDVSSISGAAIVVTDEGAVKIMF